MLEDYTIHVGEHVTMGTAPSPTAAEKTAAPTEFLKTTPAGVEIS